MTGHNECEVRIAAADRNGISLGIQHTVDDLLNDHAAAGSGIKLTQIHGFTLTRIEGASVGAGIRTDSGAVIGPVVVHDDNGLAVHHHGVSVTLVGDLDVASS